MVRIAYITDLHIETVKKGFQRKFAKRRTVRSLTEKIKSLPNDITALLFGGDTFHIPFYPFQKLLREDPLDQASIEYIKEQQEVLADLFMETLSRITDLPVFFCPGNIDYFAYFHLVSRALPNASFVDEKVADLTEGIAVVGLGGIFVEKSSPFHCLTESPFPGYFRKDAYYERVIKISSFSVDWQKTIFMTHLPAFRHVDTPWPTPRFIERLRGKPKNNGDGEQIITDFIYEADPLVHLTGHVHGAPFPNGVYDPKHSFSVINGRTVSINPGGWDLHDPDTKMVLVDVSKLMNYRSQNKKITPEIAAEAIRHI